MAEQTCTHFLDFSVKLVSYRRSFFLGFCVLNFVFSLVATLANLLVNRALMNNSTIPATVKRLFLSLAFSDLAVGLYRRSRRCLCSIYETTQFKKIFKLRVFIRHQIWENSLFTTQDSPANVQ